MSLSPGTKLGPYEIGSPLGAGGMGEVYRAKDTRLGRDVAVKLIPAHLSQNPEVRERFEREARVVSSLNHPNICTLFDVGRDGDAEYFVMELLEGESLATRLERGAMRPEEALKYASQIADALAAAHKQGIVHRDLKPANVALTKTGAKVLDFGIAKLREEQVVDMATRTTPLTTAGTMVGTIQYMAPEQLEGKPVDHRSDLFAFGALLYEMLTGRRAFDGGSQASMIVAILTTEPRAVSELIPASPPAVDRIVKLCLAKDPEERWQSAGDLARELRFIADGRSTSTTTSGSAPAVVVTRKPRIPVWLASALVVAGAAIAAATGWTLHRPPAQPLIRSSIVLPASAQLDSDNASLKLAPDGSAFVYAAAEEGKPLQLWVRSLSSLVAQPLAGTEGATYPFWSPDGKSIGFFADRKLKKVPASGGAVVTLCPAEEGRGASWGEGDVIVFSPNVFAALYQVPAAGGQPVALTDIGDVAKEQVTHRNPHFLPGGKKLLYFSGKPSADETNGIYALDLATKKSTKIMTVDSEGVYVAPGYLAFVRDGNLMAQPFDPSSLKLSGEAVPVAEKVQFNSNRRTGTYAFSETGLLLYYNGTILSPRQLTVYDLDGKVTATLGEPAMFWMQLAVSPDDKTAALAIRKPETGSDLLVYDLSRGTSSKLNSDQRDNMAPVFSPDGRLVVYRDTPGYFWVRSVDGATPPRKVSAQAEAVGIVVDWSPDGSTLLVSSLVPKTGFDVCTLSLHGDGKLVPFAASPANETFAAFSRDGRWIAYLSDESGKTEMYLAPYPGPGGKSQISTGGAAVGGWLGAGRELWYANADGKFFAVPVTVQGAGVEFGTRRPLFGGQPLRFEFGQFTHDGKHFVAAVSPVTSTGPMMTLVNHWSADLTR
ncbi:MAG TPA: protein kinase [Candidatus Polarisedimenticolaceae bacterium]|nr:protein kinase [Candidatus Polarisedimenticolaceae bacterium]